MEARQVPLVLVLAACVAMLVAVPVLGVGDGGSQSAQVNNTSETNGSFGEQISAFMQTSAVDANTSVENGLWHAAVNTSESPDQQVTSRAHRLERDLQRLERKVTRLQRKHANGTIPEVAYTAQASALRERLVNLREQINGTERTAKRVGVNTSSLDRLRTQAANLTGPEVSAIARNITDAPRGPPPGVPGGPPDRVGPDNETGPQGNRTEPPAEAGPQGNRTGPPAEVGPPGNKTGPPAAPQGPSSRTGGQNETHTGPPAEPRGPAGNQTATPGSPSNDSPPNKPDQPDTDAGRHFSDGTAEP